MCYSFWNMSYYTLMKIMLGVSTKAQGTNRNGQFMVFHWPNCALPEGTQTRPRAIWGIASILWARRRLPSQGTGTSASPRDYKIGVFKECYETVPGSAPFASRIIHALRSSGDRVPAHIRISWRLDFRDIRDIASSLRSPDQLIVVMTIRAVYCGCATEMCGPIL